MDTCLLNTQFLTLANVFAKNIYLCETIQGGAKVSLQLLV